MFASNAAFNTSANLTLQGLGYTDRANIEVGSTVELTSEDWTKIFNIIANSRQVDDVLYARFKDFVDQHPKGGAPASFPELLPSRKTHTISSLPATENPAKLAAFYFCARSVKFTPEEVRRAIHDLVTFQVPSSLNATEFDQCLGASFLKTPFVTDFVEFLQVEGSLRFGSVNNWIHQKCEDVPLPYRWEIKENTRIFYDWLAYYIPDITWDRPQHSQVIRWKQT